MIAVRHVVTAERLLAAEQHTREHYSAEQGKPWRQLREQAPDRVAMVEEMGRRLREE